MLHMWKRVVLITEAHLSRNGPQTIEEIEYFQHQVARKITQ